LGDLLEHVSDGPAARALVEMVLLSDDLLQRQGYLTGEVKEVRTAVLTAAQARDEEPLPGYLVIPEEVPPGVRGADAVWAVYFRRVAEIAGQRGCGFLAAWTTHEVALRNALATERARALGLDADGYLVVPELGETDASFETLLSEWGAARDPLAGLRVLDRARWTWLDEHDRWYSFADDELAAYAVRLMLLHRWHRLNEADEASSHAPTGKRSS
jgi:hypothetical protein